MRVLGFGDNIIDRFVDRGIDYPGGNAVNVAVYTRRLGIESAYLGVFGSDELGAFLREAIEDSGVSTERCLVKHGPSGVSLLTVVNGDRVFGGYDGGVTIAAPIDLDDGRFDYVSGFDLVHSSVYSATERLVPQLRRTGALVTFDFSSEPEFRSHDYLKSVAPHVDLALFSCSDLDDESARELLASAIHHGARLALGTRGMDGALVTDGVTWERVAAKPVVPPHMLVDTMGCGDAFVAGFIASLLRSAWAPDSTPDAATLRAALDAGAHSAWQQCFVEAAFGHGRIHASDELTGFAK